MTPEYLGIKLRMLESLLRPPIVLPRGYFILDMRPGAINRYRILGDTSRPLSKLVEFEKSIYYNP